MCETEQGKDEDQQYIQGLLTKEGNQRESNIETKKKNETSTKKN